MKTKVNENTMLKKALDQDSATEALNKISPESAREILEVTESYGTLGFKNLRQPFQNWILQTLISKEEFEANLTAAINNSGEWKFDWDSNALMINIPGEKDLFIETSQYLSWASDHDLYRGYHNSEEESLHNCEEHAVEFIMSNLNEMEVGDDN